LWSLEEVVVEEEEVEGAPVDLYIKHLMLYQMVLKQ
jgi:hypothetical protein